MKSFSFLSALLPLAALLWFASTAPAQPVPPQCPEPTPPGQPNMNYPSTPRFGTGCAGGQAVPLTIRTSSIPIPGQSVQVSVTAPGALFVFVIVGLSDTVDVNGAQLPINMASQGFPACDRWVSNHAQVSATSGPNGVWDASVPIIGLSPGDKLYLQAYAIVPMGSSTTLAMSPAWSLTVFDNEPFKVAMMPDTQYYVVADAQGNTPFLHHFDSQGAFVGSAANQALHNIQFVTHVGDIIDHGHDVTKAGGEWNRAADAMDPVTQSGVPMSVLPGNHDYKKAGKATYNTAPRDAADYKSKFGPQHFSNECWFLGASPNGLSTAQMFVAEGRQYLHLALEFRVWDDQLEWALDVLRAYPTLPTILSTHDYIGDHAPTAPGIRSMLPTARESSKFNAGEDLYQKVIVPNPQVFMVLCGHYINPSAPRYGWNDVTTTPLGSRVVETMINFQNDGYGVSPPPQWVPTAGNGWMELIEIDPGMSKIRYRPHSETFATGIDHSINSDVSFDITFDMNAFRADIEAGTVLHFRQGQENAGGTYGEAVDTYLDSSNAGASQGASVDLKCDGSPEKQVLLKFGGIVGGGSGQIPAGSRIKKAVLTLTTEGGVLGDGAKLHRMRVPWTSSSTWSSLTGGVSRNGIEAETFHDAERTPLIRRGTHWIDVTTSVQSWVDSSAMNHGWVFVMIPSNSRVWSFRSSEWGGVVERPMLTVWVDN